MMLPGADPEAVVALPELLQRVVSEAAASDEVVIQGGANGSHAPGWVGEVRNCVAFQARGPLKQESAVKQCFLR